MNNADIADLKRPSVRPLRSTAKARDTQGPVQSFSVEALKNGGTMEMGGMLEERSIREQYRGKGPAPSARRSQNSQLSPQEQVEKLGKIRKSAVEYEGVFVDQLVKQMRQSPMTKTPGGDTFSDIAEQPFRDFLSQNGGIGLADTIVGQVARQEGLEQTLQENPGIMGAGWRPTVPQNLMQKHTGNLTMPTEPLEQQGQTAPDGLMGSILAGAAKVSQGASDKAESQKVGMVSSEEISYLYNEAQEGQA